MTLRDLREAAYLSQMELAIRVGVTTSTISTWERGIKRPALANIRRLAEIYGKTPKEIDVAIDATVAARTGTTTQQDAILDESTTA
jgi:transcriptional regulator with XRE-family HTH domain